MRSVIRADFRRSDGVTLATSQLSLSGALSSQEHLGPKYNKEGSQIPDNVVLFPQKIDSRLPYFSSLDGQCDAFFRDFKAQLSTELDAF